MRPNKAETAVRACLTSASHMVVRMSTVRADGNVFAT